jgi:phage terminase small subunit
VIAARRFLTDRDLRFVDHYLVLGVAATAARKAGFSASTCRNAYALLRDPTIIQEIERRRGDQLRRLGVDADRVIQEIARVAFSDPRRLIGPDGNLLPLEQLSDEDAAGIAGVEITVRGPEGKATVTKIKRWDKARCLELLARHHGLLNDKLQMQGGLSIVIDAPDLQYLAPRHQRPQPNGHDTPPAPEMLIAEPAPLFGDDDGSGGGKPIP